MGSAYIELTHGIASQESEMQHNGKKVTSRNAISRNLIRTQVLKESSKALLQARLAKKSFFFGQHLSREYWPPSHENLAMGFFWGVDQDYR